MQNYKKYTRISFIQRFYQYHILYNHMALQYYEFKNKKFCLTYKDFQLFIKSKDRYQKSKLKSY